MGRATASRIPSLMTSLKLGRSWMTRIDTCALAWHVASRTSIVGGSATPCQVGRRVWGSTNVMPDSAGVWRAVATQVFPTFITPARASAGYPRTRY